MPCNNNNPSEKPTTKGPPDSPAGSDQSIRQRSINQAQAQHNRGTGGGGQTARAIILFGRPPGDARETNHHLFGADCRRVKRRIIVGSRCWLSSADLKATAVCLLVDVDQPFSPSTTIPLASVHPKGTGRLFLRYRMCRRKHMVL